ncbi:hypothetical protein ACJX0J_028711, partial [Zea mays]
KKMLAQHIVQHLKLFLNVASLSHFMNHIHLIIFSLEMKRDQTCMVGSTFVNLGNFHHLDSLEK